MDSAEDAHKALADLGSALLRMPGDDHRPLLGAVGRCLCTVMHASHEAGEDGRLALRLATALDALLRQASERNRATEAELSSLVLQLEQWTTAEAAPAAPAEPERGDDDDAPERAAIRLGASVTEQRAAIERQLMADDAAFAAALERRSAARAQARGGSGGSRWRTVLMGLVMPAATIALSVVAHKAGKGSVGAWLAEMFVGT